MKNTIKMLAGLTSLTLSLGAQAGTIDLFEEPDLQKVADDTNTGIVSDQYKDESAPFTIFSGYRDLVLDARSGVAAGVSEATLLVDGDPNHAEGTVNRLSWSNDEGVTSVASVQWDGNDPVNTHELQTDGTAYNLIDQEGCGTGCTGFSFTILASDLGFDFEIGVYSSDTNYVTIAAASQAISEPLDIFLPFSIFDGTTGCGDFDTNLTVDPNFHFFRTCGGTNDPNNAADMTAVTALELKLWNTATDPNDITVCNEPDPNDCVNEVSVDLAVSAITKIPEPTTLALLGAGLMGFGFARRKLSKR